MGQKIVIIEKDELFNESASLIVSLQIGSISLLQRRLRLGYNRACRIMQQLEEGGIVGEFNNAGARKVLVKNAADLKMLIAKIA